MPPSSSNTRSYLQLRGPQPDVDELPASFRSAQNAVTVHHRPPLLTKHAARLQTNPMGRAGSDWNARTKGSVSNQSRLMVIRARAAMPFREATKALAAEGLLDADLQNALALTIGPRIPDKVCLSSYLMNVMRLCSLYLTPTAKLLNVLERSTMFAAYIFSVVTTSRVQNPHIKVVTGSRFINSQRHRVIEVDFFPCHRCIVHQEADPSLCLLVAEILRTILLL